MLRSLRNAIFLSALALTAALACAGGPRFVAGTTYFNPSVTGQPVVWNEGTVAYFVDQGSLSPAVDHATAVTTIAAAADVWNAVPTAAIAIMQAGTLAEDVSSTNVLATPDGITMPADIQPGATMTPVAIVFDADGSVIDAFYGLHASNPDDCIHNGVLTRVDNLATSGNIAHAVAIINGLCTGTAPQLLQIQFQMVRAFGRILGLDWSQANEDILFGPGDPSSRQLQGWPLMRPIDINCNQLSVECIPSPLQLRADDLASISRLYPVTSASLARYPQKIITAAATLSIHGTVSFHRGQGMQGINVVARPITPGVLLPDDRYPATSVTGFLFTGNRGNPVTGLSGPAGNPLAQYGSTDPATQGYYDLTGIPLPPGAIQADYEITLEPINPLYTGTESVGPYALGSPTPSGTLPSITLRGLAAGMSIQQDFTIPDSAADEQPGTGGSPASPSTIPAAGDWHGRIATPGQTQWFAIPVLAGRHFTFDAEALDTDPGNNPNLQPATPTENKLRTLLGIWNAADPTTSPPVNAAIAPFNGASLGVTALAVDTVANGTLLLGIADQRGDGRPDYVFHGRLLSASAVSPDHLPLTGGPITITGSGFRPGMLVTLGPNLAIVTDTTPTTLVALAPPVLAPTGSLDLVLTDPATNGIAALAAGISYGAASHDILSIVTAPPAILGTGIPATFTLRVLAADQTTPAGNIPISFSVLTGSATLSACPSTACSVNTTGDGYATIQATATTPGSVKLQAALSNGNTLFAEFTAITPPSIASLAAPLFLAPSSTWLWTPQVLISPVTINLPVTWTLPATNFATTTLTTAQGIATTQLTLGPWLAGTAVTLTACAAASCVAIPAYTVHPETEILSPISGATQQLTPGQPPAPILLRLLAPAGQPIVAGTVTLTATLRAWPPPCTAAALCPTGRVLAIITQSATSAIDGSVTFSPSLNTTQSAVFTGLAIAGPDSTVPVAIQIHP